MVADGAGRGPGASAGNEQLAPQAPARAQAHAGVPPSYAASSWSIALVIPLGLDTFAVSATLGMLDTTASTRRRMSLLFTGFEAGMPLIGLALGAPLAHVIGGAADYVAIAVLLAFGLFTLLGSDQREERLIPRLAGTRGAALLLLGLSISLDELAIGFTLGLLRLPVALVIALIAVQTFAFAQIGFRVGHRLSHRLREAAERIAGAVLTVLALVLLAERLLS